MTIGVVSVGTLAPVMLWIISKGNTWDALLAQSAIGVMLALFAGPFFAWLPENFPPKVRLTSASLSYNLGICLSAGFSPAVATALVQDFGPLAPGAIYPFFAILALIGMFMSTKIRREEEVNDADNLRESLLLGTE